MGIPIFALEGIGGSGKSHILKILADRFSANRYSVLTHKIGGLGDTPSIRLLKNIRLKRLELKRNGQWTDRWEQDRLRDRLYRIAMRQQIREFQKELGQGDVDVVLLDRTPLMIWAFAAANNVLNPYLSEIETEVLCYAEKLNLTKVYLFDLPIEIAYARIIIRYWSPELALDDFVQEACHSLGATENETLVILENTLPLVETFSQYQHKTLDGWDAITPLFVKKMERNFHKQILLKCQRQFGLQFQLIDVNQPIQTVADCIYRDMLLAMNVPNLATQHVEVMKWTKK